jgi:hypothetical protein
VQSGGLTATGYKQVGALDGEKDIKVKRGTRGLLAATPAGVRLDSMVGTQASAIARWQWCSSTRADTSPWAMPDFSLGSKAGT